MLKNTVATYHVREIQFPENNRHHGNIPNQDDIVPVL